MYLAAINEQFLLDKKIYDSQNIYTTFSLLFGMLQNAGAAGFL